MEIKYSYEESERDKMCHIQCSACGWDYYIIEVENYNEMCKFLEAQGWQFAGGWKCSDCMDEDRRFSRFHHETD